MGKHVEKEQSFEAEVAENYARAEWATKARIFPGWGRHRSEGAWSGFAKNHAGDKLS